MLAPFGPTNTHFGAARAEGWRDPSWERGGCHGALRCCARSVNLGPGCCWPVDLVSVPACSKYSQPVMGFAGAQKGSFWGRRRARVQAPWRCAGDGAQSSSAVPCQAGCPGEGRWAGCAGGMPGVWFWFGACFCFVWGLFLPQPLVTQSCGGGSCGAGSLRAPWGHDVLALVGWRRLQPLPQGDPNLFPANLISGHPKCTWAWRSMGRCEHSKFWGVRAVPRRCLQCWEGEDVTQGPSGSLCGRAEQLSLPPAAPASEESHFIYPLTC